MAGRETLSPSQARAVVGQSNIIILRAQKQMEQKNQEFTEKVSQLWEDNNAVTFIKQHKINMDNIVNNLSKNGKVFAETVEGIANMYADAGNKEHVSVEKQDLHPNFIIDAIKDTFDGDMFGFSDTSAYDSVMEAFKTLVSELNNIAFEAVAAIQKINAFGNPQVQAAIAKSAGKILEILNEQIAEASDLLHKCLQETADVYNKVGSKAIEAGNLQKGGN